MYDVVTAQIIAQLEKGCLPWRQPWGKLRLGLPCNAKSKRHYTGINILMLYVASLDQDFAGSYWATERQWESMGAKPRADAIAAEIVACFRRVKVYHLSQMVGCDHLRNQTALPPLLAEVDKIKQLAVIVEADEAIYDPQADFIKMPRRDHFETDASYCTTLFHEMAHWTGHPSRLCRQFAPNGTTAYAKEELVAELATCFLAEDLRIEADFPNHVNYIGDYLQALRNDNRFIFKAASKAQRAVKFLKGAAHV